MNNIYFFDEESSVGVIKHGSPTRRFPLTSKQLSWELSTQRRLAFKSKLLVTL